MSRHSSRYAAALVLLLMIGAAGPASAHSTSTGVASLMFDDRVATYRLALSMAELPSESARLLARAIDGDPVAAGEVAAMLGQRVRLAVADQPCRPGRVQVQGSRLGDERVVLQLRLTCAEANGRLELTDDLSGVFGEHYRSIVSLQSPDGGHQEQILEAGSHRATFDLTRQTPRGGFEFLKLGIEHILSGLDHLLFLVALLLGTQGIWRVFAVVTAFTLAHSLTLCAAALGWLTIPASVIEPLIAASIGWMAAENLLADGTGTRRWFITFAFGLIHGFGFASALAEVELSGWPLVRALLGFNAGVEVGQAAVALLLVPLFARLGRRAGWPRIQRVLSGVLMVIGMGWSIERLL